MHGNVCRIRELGNMYDAADIVDTLHTLLDHPFYTVAWQDQYIIVVP